MTHDSFPFNAESIHLDSSFPYCVHVIPCHNDMISLGDFDIVISRLYFSSGPQPVKTPVPRGRYVASGGLGSETRLYCPSDMISLSYPP